MKNEMKIVESTLGDNLKGLEFMKECLIEAIILDSFFIDDQVKSNLLVDSPHPLERNQHGDFRNVSACTKIFYDAPSSSSSPNIANALQSHMKKIVSLKINLKVWNQSTMVMTQVYAPSF